MLERWRERDVFAESLRLREGCRAVGLLRGPPHGERPAGLPPRALARVQGHLPALPDDARLPGRAQGRLGLPRAAGGDRGRTGARHHARRAKSRTLSGSSGSTPLPRVGVRVPGGVEPADRADRLLARPRARLPHARRDLHRVGLVGAVADRSRAGCCTRGTRLCPTARAARRRCPRTRSRSATRTLSTARSTCVLPVSSAITARCMPATRCSSGRRRRGRCPATSRSRRSPDGRPTCARGSATRPSSWRQARVERGARRGGGDPRAILGQRAGRGSYYAGPDLRAERPRAGRVSDPRRRLRDDRGRHRASCTSRRHLARTTTAWRQPRASSRPDQPGTLYNPVSPDGTFDRRVRNHEGRSIRGALRQGPGRSRTS